MGVSKSVYRRLWRWHFFAGLFCIPFVLTLSISGAIYLFKPQIDNWQRSPYQQLSVSHELSAGTESKAENLNLSTLIHNALTAVPNSRFLNAELPTHPNHAVILTLVKEQQRLLAYLHPQTGELLNVEPADQQFIRLVRRFHGELLAGKMGSVLVELAGCWAIVLIVTGLILWLPRRQQQGMGGVLYPRLRAGGRTFWRDLHAVTGVWLAAFTLFLLISGLPWTLLWGSAFKEVRQWVETPQVSQDWKINPGFTPLPKTDAPACRQPSPALVAAAKKLDFAPPVLLAPNATDCSIWTLKSRHQNRPLRANAWLNRETGEVIKLIPFAERKLIDRIIGIGVAAHEGHLFGWFNILLGLVTTVGLILISISGLIMWYRRKPTDKLGTPEKTTDHQGGKVLLYTLLPLSVLLPVLAVSIVILFIAEWIIARCFPKAATWLGV